MLLLAQLAAELEARAVHLRYKARNGAVQSFRCLKGGHGAINCRGKQRQHAKAQRWPWRHTSVNATQGHVLTPSGRCQPDPAAPHLLHAIHQALQVLVLHSRLQNCLWQPQRAAGVRPPAAGGALESAAHHCGQGAAQGRRAQRIRALGRAGAAGPSRLKQMPRHSRQPLPKWLETPSLEKQTSTDLGTARRAAGAGGPASRHRRARGCRWGPGAHRSRSCAQTRGTCCTAADRQHSSKSRVCGVREWLAEILHGRQVDL